MVKQNQQDVLNKTSSQKTRHIYKAPIQNEMNRSTCQFNYLIQIFNKIDNFICYYLKVRNDKALNIKKLLTISASLNQTRLIKLISKIVFLYPQAYRIQVLSQKQNSQVLIFLDKKIRQDLQNILLRRSIFKEKILSFIQDQYQKFLNENSVRRFQVSNVKLHKQFKIDDLKIPQPILKPLKSLTISQNNKIGFASKNSSEPVIRKYAHFTQDYVKELIFKGVSHQTIQKQLFEYVKQNQQMVLLKKRKDQKLQQKRKTQVFRSKLIQLNSTINFIFIELRSNTKYLISIQQLIRKINQSRSNRLPQSQINCHVKFLVKINYLERDNRHPNYLKAKTKNTEQIEQIVNSFQANQDGIIHVFDIKQMK